MGHSWTVFWHILNCILLALRRRFIGSNFWALLPQFFFPFFCLSQQFLFCSFLGGSWLRIFQHLFNSPQIVQKPLPSKSWMKYIKFLAISFYDLWCFAELRANVIHGWDLNLPCPENTHRWAEYHCPAGLQFRKFGLDWFGTYY